MTVGVVFEIRDLAQLSNTDSRCFPVVSEAAEWFGHAVLLQTEQSRAEQSSDLEPAACRANIRFAQRLADDILPNAIAIGYPLLCRV